MTRTAKNIVRLGGLLAATGVIAACLAGCARQELDTLVIVEAQVQGQPAVVPSVLDPYLGAIDEPGDRVVVIMADGSPHAVFDQTVSGDLPTEPHDRDDALVLFRDGVVAAAMAARPTHPETDPAEAVALAAEALSAASGRKQLVVITSGLQTIGALAMTKGRLELPVTELVADGAKVAAEPDLSGVSVSMPRLGVTEAPQPPLPQAYVGKLAELWRDWLTRSHAASIDTAPISLVSRPLTDPVDEPVTPVPVDRVALPCATGLDTAAVSFTVGTASFADPAAARASIKDVAERLSSCSGTWLAEGSASSEGDPEFNQKLSEERAAAVAAVLAVVAGTQAPSIKVIGYGIHWPCRVEDTDAAGNLDESAALANRVVVLSKGVRAGSC